MKVTKTILLAPHDDGFGAFSTMRVLADTLLARAKSEGIALQLVFISGKKGAKELGHCAGADTHLLKADLLYEIMRAPESGAVSPPAILEVLKKISVEAPYWESGIDWKMCLAHEGKDCGLTWDSIDLCIGMGVPWLHRAARRHNKPSIELGDTSVSMVLRGCLEEGGLLTPFAGRILDDVAENELLAGEAWLLPFATPPVYETHYASGGVPVNWLPGLFGTREDDAEGKAKKLRTDISPDPRVGSRPMVGVHAGMTISWEPIRRQLAALNPSGKCAYVTAGSGRELYPLTLTAAGGVAGIASIAALPGTYTERSTSLRAQDLCLTRGGISVLEHIVACCPIAITEEPLHWLSHEQRAALIRAGLGIPISLDDLCRDPDQFCAVLLDKRGNELTRIRRRMAGIQCGADQWFADYVLRFLGP
ncbi:MAG: hypothetical protein NT049_10780 [Planctomycetota bacterium]|nr:hypothetical protein [Planctomycetota bacterium]